VRRLDATGNKECRKPDDAAQEKPAGSFQTMIEFPVRAPIAVSHSRYYYLPEALYMREKQVAAYLDRAFRGNLPARGPARSRFLRARDAFAAREVRSHADLLRLYRSFGPDERFVILTLFGRHRYHRSVPLLTEEVLSKDSRLSGIASVALGAIGGDRILRMLLHMLQKHTCGPARLVLVSALSFLEHVRSTGLWIDSLIELVQAKSEPDGCRMSSAEGLVWALDRYDRRNPRFRKAIEVLMRVLDDPSPDVRFSCVFALGELKVAAALPKLKVVARTDHATCSGHSGHPGGWTVSREARAAIRAIQWRAKRREKHLASSKRGKKEGKKKSQPPRREKEEKRDRRKR
jgi:hypothetical protein